MQVSFEGGFSADANGLAFGADGSVVTAPSRLVQPCAIHFAKVQLQPRQFAGGQFANGLNAMQFEFLICFGAHAIDLAATQGPDGRLQVFFMNDGNAIGLVELAGHFGNQFVGCNAHRAGQASGFKNAFLNQACQHPAAFTLAARHLCEINVNLVYAAVFHERRNFRDDVFEDFRVVPVLIEIHRQQNGLRAEFGGFHQPHGRANAKLPGRIGGRGDNAATGIALNAREKIQGYFRQVVGRPFEVRMG